MIQVTARAKINLCLEVLGRREDGYHEIATVLQAIALADDLVVRPSAGIVLETNDPDLDMDDNLVLRAARLLRDRTGVERGAHIVLVKRIPVAAGLGGGSADAAAALVGLAKLWELDLKDGSLAALAERLGSDVPFFLHGSGTALASGRGERVEPLPAVRHGWVVVALPDVPRPQPKTSAMFGHIGPDDLTGGSAVAGWRQALSAGAADWRTLMSKVGPYNAFHEAASKVYTGWGRAVETFRITAGPAAVAMSGTGPAVYGVYDDRHEAGKAHWALQAAGLRSWITETADRPLVVREPNPR